MVLPCKTIYEQHPCDMTASVNASATEGVNENGSGNESEKENVLVLLTTLVHRVDNPLPVLALAKMGHGHLLLPSTRPQAQAGEAMWTKQSTTVIVNGSGNESARWIETEN